MQLLDRVGPGSWISQLTVERGEGQGVVVELLPDGPGNADLTLLDSDDGSTGFQSVVDTRGSVVGVAGYRKILVTSLLPYIKARLDVAAGTWTVKATPVPATSIGTVTVAGDVNLDQYGGAPVGPGNPMDSALVTTEGAGQTIGALGDAAVVANAAGSLSGKLRGLVAILADVWDNVAHLLAVRVASSTAAKLQLNGQPRTSINCAVASTDYPAGANIPAGTKYVVAWAANLCIVAVDEATTAAVGVAIPPNTPTRFPVAFGAGDSSVHVQSPTAGTTVYITYLQD